MIGFSVGSGSPSVASWSMTLAISWPWVVRLSIRVLIRPLRSSFSTKAPTITIARASTFRVMISRPSRDPRGQRKRLRGFCEPWGAGSGFAVTVANAVQGLDGVEFRIDLTELLAHALDVAVDRAVVDIDLI